MLLCRGYNQQRKDLFDTVSILLQPLGLPNIPIQVLPKILLYGDERFLLISNSMILEAILNY